METELCNLRMDGGKRGRFFNKERKREKKEGTPAEASHP